MKQLLHTLLFFLLVTQICLGQWVQTSGPNGGKVQCLAVNESTLFAATSDSGIYRSTNNGGDWDRLVTGLQNSYVNCFASIGTNVFAGTMSQGVVRSTNNGTSWTVVNTGLTDTVVWILDNLGTNLYAGTDSGVFLSTNNGTSWMQTSLDTVTVWTFALRDTNIFAGTSGGVFLSANNGTSWTRVDTVWTPWPVSASMSTLTLSGYSLFGVYRDPYYWYCPFCSERIRGGVTAGAAPMPTFVQPTGAMVGPPPGLYLSTDHGTSWTYIAFICEPLNALAVSGTNLFAGLSDAGTYACGVLLSTDNGINWVQVNTGFEPFHLVYSLALKDTYLFAGTDSAGVWRRPISEMITSVREFSASELPSNFLLEQNYPNPFNPSTKISWQIPASLNSSKGGTLVTLKVYDMLGKEVATLVNEEESAGTYEIEFNASQLASGIYFYQLTAGEFVQTKKMVLLR